MSGTGSEVGTSRTSAGSEVKSSVRGSTGGRLSAVLVCPPCVLWWTKSFRSSAGRRVAAGGIWKGLESVRRSRRIPTDEGRPHRRPGPGRAA